jgi:hypothetical protein
MARETLMNFMIPTEEQWNVFQGVKRRGNTLALLFERATQKNISLVTAPRGCGDTYPKTQRALGLVAESEGDGVGFAVCLPGRCFASVTAARKARSCWDAPYRILLTPAFWRPMELRPSTSHAPLHLVP